MKYQFDPFIFYYDEVDWPIYDFRTECIMAAHKAASMNVKGLPIIVTMSGGLDSELIAESLYQAKIPFRALIGKLQVQVSTETIILNEHDYSYAEKWCHNHGIEIEYCNLDVYKNAQLLTEYSIFSKGFSPQYAWHMYLMKYASDNGYFFISGLGDIDIVLRNGEYYCADTQREWSIDIFCETYNLNGIIRFVKLDSRLTAAFLELKSVKSLMKDRAEILLQHKHRCFSEVFPNMENRPKFTGFEKIQEWDSILRNYMKKHNGQHDTISYIPISYFQTKEL
jgi:hypothetical protein